MTYEKKEKKKYKEIKHNWKFYAQMSGIYRTKKTREAKKCGNKTETLL